MSCGKQECCGSLCRSKKTNDTWYWVCRKHEEAHSVCEMPPVPEDAITAAFLRLYYNLKHNPEVLSFQIKQMAEVRKRQMLWSPAAVELNREISDVLSQSHALALLNRQGLVDPDIFISKSNQLAEQLRNARGQKEKLRDMDTELIITFMSAFAQSESESISANVRWGKKQAMKEGKVNSPIWKLYGYGTNDAGELVIVPEEAEVVRRIYARILAGDSLRIIRDTLNADSIPAKGGKEWHESTVRGIITNEKYCGDVLMQKTFKTDLISGKIAKNTGQLPMYLIRDNHPGIVTRDTFQAVQTELARRSAGKSPSRKNAPTGRSCYTSKYALSERVFCGECGTRYQRCSWHRKDKVRIVWRCISRVEYGSRYCHQSPTMDEEPLQQAIMAAVNSIMDSQETINGLITDAALEETGKLPNSAMTLGDINRRLEELEAEFNALFNQSGGIDKNAALERIMAADMPQIELYCEIGKAVCQRREKGAAVAAAAYLRKQYPDMQGFSPRNLRRMRDFYRTYEDHPDLLTLTLQIGWTQNIVILETDLSMELREWYLRAVNQFHWSKAELIERIVTNAHEMIDLAINEEVCYMEKQKKAADQKKSIRFLCNAKNNRYLIERIRRWVKSAKEGERRWPVIWSLAANSTLPKASWVTTSILRKTKGIQLFSIWD